MNTSSVTSCDVVVVGAGIAGLTVALELKRRGLNVVVLDKGAPGYEQSSRNWGWVRSISQDPHEIELSLDSRAQWQEWARQGDFGYRQCGLISLARNTAEMNSLLEWKRSVGSFADDIETLGPQAIRQHLAQSRGKWVGALYSSHDGVAEPDRTMAFLMDLALREQIVIESNIAVKAIDVAGGRVQGVITETGRIAAPQVVVATGIWSRWLCEGIGIALPQLRVIASVMRTTPVPDGPEPVVASSSFSVRRRMDGGYTVAQRNSSISYITPDTFRFLKLFFPAFLKQHRLLSVRLGAPFVEHLQLDRQFGAGKANPFEIFRRCDPAPDRKTLLRTMARLRDDMPVFRQARIMDMWAGVIDVTPDSRPIISDVAGCPGLYLSTGYSAHGFGLAPGAGRLAADIVTDTAGWRERARAFSLSRF
ncbi:FAD-dependent oxidoreductase [Novacetimonas maltaceti]|uniref:D-amino acid dehydrogenase small subunit n=1 Tax=Novacetimonas maltaceti TaxID=1203393 RepID=A0A2S3W227_9PROT|nr:FAD-binding oxidoreductase [Novacetimonas maltaceti]POF62919.1 D-amino acid dehydrogenase small subunit [Novacetimonas maltaceti]PYD61770.1 FAD-dependent oxidoreductase [Novacetimonas maltaceti]